MLDFLEEASACSAELDERHHVGTFAEPCELPLVGLSAGELVELLVAERDPVELVSPDLAEPCGLHPVGRDVLALSERGR